VPLWTKRYNGPENGYDFATAVAVDASGNVFVTGYSYDSDSGGNWDYATIAYSGAGVPLWTNRYVGSASAVAVDANGNVFVTGSSTIKYSGAGVPLWTNRYIGSASAVAVDGTGNVVVTGNTFLMDYRESDYYTAKYASADGALLWEKRFKGPGGVGDSPHCLALGPGTVAVTGTSNGGYGTVVYRDVPALSIDLIPTGIRLRFSGLPARGYKIERAHAVIGPWSTLNVQTAPASGTFEYVDINLPAAATFYRASEP